MVNSLDKGKAYERKIAKLLSKRFKVDFHRVPMSGAMSTTTQVKTPQLAGDIFTDSKRWNKAHNVVIECKKIGKPIDLVQYAKYLIGNGVMLSKWVAQATKEANLSGRNGFWLIFSWNHGKDLIIAGKLEDGEWVIHEPVILQTFLAHIVK